MMNLLVNWESVEEVFANVEVTRSITYEKMRKLTKCEIDTTTRNSTKVIADTNGNELICHYDTESLLKREFGKCDVCSTECILTGLPVDIETQDNITFIYDTTKFGKFCSTKCIRKKLSTMKLTETALCEVLGVMTTLTLAEQQAKALEPIDEILVGNNLFFLANDIIIIRLPCTMPELRTTRSSSHPLGIYVRSPKSTEIVEKLKCASQ